MSRIKGKYVATVTITLEVDENRSGLPPYEEIERTWKCGLNDWVKAVIRRDIIDDDLGKLEVTQTYCDICRVEEGVETTQPDHIADSGKKVERTAETAQDVQSVDDALTLLDSIHSGGRMMYSDYCALHDAISSISVQTVIDDTVSRKAAIDALKEAFNPSIANFVKAKIAIDKLSSAQPEVLACGEGELSVEPEQRWITCSERLPKEGSYLVWMPFAPPEERIAVADYCDGYWNIKTPISAWMPLPEPYRGGEKE